jgi:formamidopyrimidine-DNA glycosylase
MPELPEVETARLELLPAMVGARFVTVELRRRDLRRPFARGFASRLRGATVTALTRRGKFLVVALSTGETLVMHLGMSGSFQVRAVGRTPDSRLRHDHVIFTMSSRQMITYNDPRRFGAMDLVRSGELAGFAPLAAMGPEPLDGTFDGATLARACRGKRVPIKVALLDQRVVAGVGNIYASEALHIARLSPKRPASSIAHRSGAPRPSAHRLAAAIQQVLREAIARQATAYRASRFLVYEREGETCRRRHCGGTIARITQAGRSTFFCPRCQH